MLKGHVFSKQLFEHPIFALFINTFLNGANGVSNNYKNAMKITSSGSNVTIDSGAVCIQGRFLEEDSYTTLPAGTDNSYCRLVIEINLDKQNTESVFNQASYKIIKGSNAYPNLTQTNIVKNNSGVYQYELARFRTSASGITDFTDMRTYLDFKSIYDEMKKEYKSVLTELQNELASVEDGSAYLLKNNIAVLTGQVTLQAKENVGDSGIWDGSVTVFYLNFPEGFNKDNCVVISFMGRIFENRGYITGMPLQHLSAMANGAFPKTIQLGTDGYSDKILCSVMNYATHEHTYYYKIVLLKIS